MCCYRSLVFNCCIKTLKISQSSVATHLRCRGIFSDSITTIADFLLILTVKKVRKLFKTDEVTRSTKKCAKFFGGHPVEVYCTKRRASYSTNGGFATGCKCPPRCYQSLFPIMTQIRRVFMGGEGWGRPCLELDSPVCKIRRMKPTLLHLPLAVISFRGLCSP